MGDIFHSFIKWGKGWDHCILNIVLPHLQVVSILFAKMSFLSILGKLLELL